MKREVTGEKVWLFIGVALFFDTLGLVEFIPVIGVVLAMAIDIFATLTLGFMLILMFPNVAGRALWKSALGKTGLAFFLKLIPGLPAWTGWAWNMTSTLRKEEERRNAISTSKTTNDNRRAANDNQIQWRKVA